MRINDLSGEADTHGSTIGARPIIRDVLATENYWVAPNWA